MGLLQLVSLSSGQPSVALENTTPPASSRLFGKITNSGRCDDAHCPFKPSGGWEAWGSPHLGSFRVRSKLRSWEASWGPGAPALSPGSCFTGAGGNLAGVACCPFPTGEGREDGVRGTEGFIGAPTGTPRGEDGGPGGLRPPGALTAGQWFSPLT